jgi:hypothetical protein
MAVVFDVLCLGESRSDWRRNGDVEVVALVGSY